MRRTEGSRPTSRDDARDQRLSRCSTTRCVIETSRSPRSQRADRLTNEEPEAVANPADAPAASVACAGSAPAPRRGRAPPARGNRGEAARTGPRGKLGGSFSRRMSSVRVARAKKRSRPTRIARDPALCSAQKINNLYRFGRHGQGNDLFHARRFVACGVYGAVVLRRPCGYQLAGVSGRP